MKTSELLGARLGYWVIRAEAKKHLRGESRHPIPVYKLGGDREEGLVVYPQTWIEDESYFQPKDGKQHWPDGDYWEAICHSHSGMCCGRGPTAQIAAARATVMTEFVEEISDDPAVKADRKRNG